VTGQNNTLNLIVVGAGPAGLFTAIHAASPNSKILILEKNKSAGRKLLISGSGQCNLTNATKLSEFSKKYGTKKNIVKKILHTYSNKDLIHFFEKNNFPLIELQKGKIFPKSLNSKDVLELFLDLCKKKNIRINYEQTIKSIKILKGNFQVITNNSSYISKNVLISTGGKSYPNTGSTGDGYRIAESLGHSIVEIKAALCPIIVNPFIYSNCAGTSFSNIEINLYRNEKKIGQYYGDVLITHKGLSGPGILDFSRNMKANDILKLKLIDFKSPEAFNEFMLNEIKLNGKKRLKNILSPLGLTERFISNLFNKLGVNPTIKAAELNKENRKRLIENLISFTVKISNLGSFKEAMITSGGISLDEVNKHTMESKLHNGLYFAGEVLDVDGDTGGYNLQFAFSSAILVSSHILNHY
jgi:predicted Rossmann fold flavoprotein